jgi:hypothetical protein
MIHVAMIGVGAISGIYLKNLTETFGEVSCAAWRSIEERAQKAEFVASTAKRNRCGRRIYKPCTRVCRPQVKVILNLPVRMRLRGPKQRFWPAACLQRKAAGR